MFNLYVELSKAADFYNSRMKTNEQLEYYEILEMIEDKHNEKEIMETIIFLYSQVQ